jgi:hypothetical protein
MGLVCVGVGVLLLLGRGRKGGLFGGRILGLLCGCSVFVLVFVSMLVVW